MADNEITGRITAIRGAALTFDGDPFIESPETSVTYLVDAVLVMEDGKITQFGQADKLLPTLKKNVPIEHYSDSLILPGFIDSHVHYPQAQIIGAGGETLIDWLNKYTFAAEQAYGDGDHAKRAARQFFDELLRNGTTTAAVFCTVHPGSVDMFFAEAQRRAMRMVGGKVLMDRNAPVEILDTAQRGYDDSKTLIDRWHGKDRLHYAITPRFAPSCSPDQLAAAGALWGEYPTTYMQSHLAETPAEIDWVAELFPDRAGYLDVYDHFGLIGERSIYGHGIYLTEAEWRRISDTGTAIAHCPTSNLFLGSGLFNIGDAKTPGRRVKVGLATDLGAGTSFSMLQTMASAYNVARLRGEALSATQAFYLATRGAAEALSLDDKIGRLAPGLDADVIVLDLKSTPLIDYRMQFTDTLEQMLFVQMTLGDDRAIRATYIAGEPAHRRN
jgi:guanine deaminase